MNENKIKQITREIMMPFFDELVDLSSKVYITICNQLPTSMPESEKDDLVRRVIKSHGDSLAASVKSGIPKDFENQLKEAFNGRK